MLRDHLIRLRPDQQTPFETVLLSNDDLMIQISRIADSANPQCIWRKGGWTKELFQFLGPRFIGAPDSVLDCEGVHAAWKFIHLQRRAMKFKLLNALMRLKSYIAFYGSLPPFESLERIIANIDAGRRAQCMAIAQDPNIDTRFKADWHYRERFNLRAVDVDLLREPRVHDGGDDADANSIDVAWGNYVKKLFVPHAMYRFANTERFLYVAENKSLPSREGG